MFLSQEINIKLCQNYTKTHSYKIWYKILSLKQIIFSKCTTNLKTTISQRSLKNSDLLLLLFAFNIFSFLIDIIDNIIVTSLSRDQNFYQWQCSIRSSGSVCITHVRSVFGHKAPSTSTRLRI